MALLLLFQSLNGFLLQGGSKPDFTQPACTAAPERPAYCPLSIKTRRFQVKTKAFLITEQKYTI